MPTYDYECDDCGHEMEAFQSIKAKPLKDCPACGQRKLRRLIGPGGGIIFKGSGFYTTDYRSESYKAGAKAEKETSSKTTKDTKTDTKDNKSSKKNEK